MHSYQEALDFLTNRSFTKPEIEKISIHKAIGRVLAKPVCAQVSNPAFTNSAMDGYAICSEVLRQATKESPIILGVQEIAAAGDRQISLSNHKNVIEITTGAPLPSGADAVVKIEDILVSSNADDGLSSVEFAKPSFPGENVRELGEDFKENEQLLSQVGSIHSKELMLAIASGVKEVEVYKKLTAVVIVTGSELVDIDLHDSLKSGEIFNSCGPYLYSKLEGMGIDVVKYHCVKDNESEFESLVVYQLRGVPDFIITSGAVSKGRYDFIPRVLDRIGVSIGVHGVKVKPGKPFLFGSLKSSGKPTYFFGLPGNPVSVMAGVEFFLKPFVNSWLGLSSIGAQSAKLVSTIDNSRGLTRFLLGRLTYKDGGCSFDTISSQQSFMLAHTAKCNAWGILPGERQKFFAGEVIDIQAI